MTAARYDLVIEQGATFTLEFTVKDGATPVNLTGYAARMQFRRKHSAVDADLSLTSAAGGGITLGGAAGTVAVRVEADVTADLAERLDTPGVWDFELEAPDGTVTREMEGQYQVTPEVTR
jgi:hypothetical protein